MKLHDIKDDIKSNLREKTNACRKYRQLDSTLTATVMETQASTDSQGLASNLLVENKKTLNAKQ